MSPHSKHNRPPARSRKDGAEPTNSGTSPAPAKTAAATAKSGKRKARAAALVCVALALAVALVFGQTVGHDFVNYDDNEYVYENPRISGGITVRGIAWALTAGHAGNWHPLTWLSHMLDYRLYGLWSGGHHLTNVLLHAVAAALLFLALWRMTGALWQSALAAAVFAVHPLRAESVAWVAERKDVLAGLFFMLTLWAYLLYVRRLASPVRYLAVAVLYGLGLMAKPMLVTLPFVLLLLDFWPLGRMGRPEAGGPFALFRRALLEKLPLLALAAASSVATFLVQAEAVVPMEAIPLSARIANAMVSAMAYLGKFFYPTCLTAFYPYPWGGLPLWQVGAAALALAGISAAAAVWRRRFPFLFVGWFWYLGMLVPVIGLVQVGSHAMADRYTYLPQIGLCISIVWSIAQGIASTRRLRPVCGAAAALAVLVLMAMGWRQVSTWRNSETLWTHALACTARNFVAHSNLGDALAKKGQRGEAIRQYEAALDIRPHSAEIHFNLGIALAETGQSDKALVHYRKAAALKPDHAKAFNNLGNLLRERGQSDAAIAHYQRALEIKPDFVEARYNLGNALADRGRSDEALLHYRKALAIDPDHAKTHNNLGNVLADRGAAGEAIAHYRKALGIKPDFAEAHNNLGIALEGSGEPEAAVAHYRKALEIKPDYADASYNLAGALANLGQDEEAAARLRKMLELNPDDGRARHGLEVLLKRRKF